MEQQVEYLQRDEGTGNGLDADTLDGEEGSYYLDYNNFTNTPSSSSGIFTASNNDLKQTHDGTQVEFDLDAVSDVTQSTGQTNVSGQTLTLSGDDFSADSRGIFFISNTNHGSKEDVIIRTNGTEQALVVLQIRDGALSLFGSRGFTATLGVRLLTTADIDIQVI